MKSTCSILSAAVFCSLLLDGRAGAENYSLWPRRPAELQQARMLMAEGKGSEAIYLLRPYWRAKGVTGQEARLLTAHVNVPRYLTRNHPGITIYTVRRGDTMPRVARNSACPQDLVMLLNGIVEPSNLKVGQKLAVVPMKQHLEIHLPSKELCVWDEDSLVATYRIEALDGVPLRGGNTDTCVKSRGVYQGGSRVRAGASASSDRALLLENGLLITGDKQMRGQVILMNQRDLNELVLLVGEKAPVFLVRDEKKFLDGFEAGAAQQPSTGDKTPAVKPTSAPPASTSSD